MSLQVTQFVQALQQTFGARYGMSAQEHDRWIARYGMPGAPQQDPSVAQLAAIAKSVQWHRSLGDWNLVAFAWQAGFSEAHKLKQSGQSIDAYAASQSRFRPAARVAFAVMSRAQAASPNLPSPNPQTMAPIVQTVINIPQAPAFDAQGEMDAWLNAQREMGAQADEEASRVNTGDLVGNVLSSLSSTVRSSAGMMSATPSPELPEVGLGVEVDDVAG